MTSKNLRRRIDDDEDDDVFDENGILKDGKTWRVPMRMADAAQLSVAAHVAARQANVAPLHAPGFVRVADAAGDASKAAAYAEVEAAMRDAYKGEPVPQAGAGAQPGDICTCRNTEYPNDFGAPGHLRMIGGKLTCVPDNPRAAAAPPVTPRPPARGTAGDAATRAVDQAYADYESDLTSSWRKP